MGALKCSKFKWVGMGARPNRTPTSQQVLKAKEWAKDNLCSNKLPAYKFYINTMLSYRMRRLVKLWAYNAIPSHRGGDVFFSKQDFLTNKQRAKKRTDLNASCLEKWLDQDICWRLSRNHDFISFVKGLKAIDKEIDRALGMITRGKNTYPVLGEKLMYDEVVALSKMTNSVYKFYAPNIK